MVKLFGLFMFFGLLFGFCGENRSDNRARVGNERNGTANSTPPDAKNRTGDSAQRFYGEKIDFRQNRPVRFADFDLTYTGERNVSSEKFPNGFRYQDFRLQRADLEQTISWSSGTGDIAPLAFTFNGKNYELELETSDKLGKLAPDELVVWEK
jgi:hypothetical protein